MKKLILAIVCISILFIFGCSGSSDNPVATGSHDTLENFPTTSDNMGNNHNMLGVWEIEFDLENLTAEVKPARETNGHINVTLLLPGPQIDIISFDGQTGVVEVDITIDNISNLDGYDIRFIVMTDSAGHMLLNPDNWTDLYDQPGGLPINPFMAYAKDEPLRLFAAHTSYTERLEILLPGGNPNVTFAVDASLPGNCTEPFLIDYFYQEDYLTPETGSSSFVEVEVYDWQFDVSSVFIYSPSLMGALNLPLEQDPVDENAWFGTISNDMSAPAGEYDGYIAAYSYNSGSQALYDKVTITVAEPIPDPPVYEWSRSIGGLDYEYIEGMCVDQSDNIYVCGYFYETCDFDPLGNYELTATDGSEDSYVAKYNNGYMQWALSWGSDYGDDAYDVAVDSSGNVYVTGVWKRTVDFDPGAGVYELTSIDNSDDCYLIKFDVNGAFQWVETWGGTGSEWGSSVEVDDSGNMYIAGYFNGTCDFDPGAGVEERTSTGGMGNLYLMKLDSSGNFSWVQTWGGNGLDKIIDFGIYNSSEIFVTGDYQYTVDFDPGTGIDEHTATGYQDTFVTKFQTDGTWLWAKTWGADSMTLPNDIDVTNDGSILIAGLFQTTGDFDPGPEEEIHTCVGAQDIYLSKLDNDGNHLWTINWGGTDYNGGWGVTSDSNGLIYMTGLFRGNADFDPGPGTDIRNSVQDDIFLTGYDSFGNYLWGYVMSGDSSNQGKGVGVSGTKLYVAGEYGNTVDFDPGAGTDNKTAVDGKDIFFCRFDLQ